MTDVNPESQHVIVTICCGMHFATAKSTWADLVSSLIYKLAACVVAKKARYLCIDPLLYLPEQMAVSATNSN